MIAGALVGLLGVGALLVQASTTKQRPRTRQQWRGARPCSSKNVPFATTTTATRKKIGPGLKGLSKRGTFSVNGNKITDESLKAWIENGDQLMPPFKDVLEAGQIKDVISYVKTL